MSKVRDYDTLDSQILKAVDNPKYKARTIEGIASELKIEPNEVRVHIRGKALSQKIVEVPGVRKNNKPLYVTTERYKKNTPLAVRVLNMIKKDRLNE